MCYSLSGKYRVQRHPVPSNIILLFHLAKHCLLCNILLEMSTTGLLRLEEEALEGNTPLWKLKEKLLKALLADTADQN